jgi:hypothetical protein
MEDKKYDLESQPHLKLEQNGNHAKYRGENYILGNFGMWFISFENTWEFVYILGKYLFS